MFDFSPKVEFLLCHAGNQLNNFLKKNYEKYTLSPTSTSWHAVSAHWQWKGKIFKLSMIIGFGEECF